MLLLSNSTTYATIPTQDIARARSFYEGKLGLTVSNELPGGVFFRLDDGSEFLVFPSSGSANGTHTQMSFRVSDIEAVVGKLQADGVTFEEYENPKTENGIAALGPAKAAWLKDPDGNLLGIFQPPQG